MKEIDNIMKIRQLDIKRRIKKKIPQKYDDEHFMNMYSNHLTIPNKFDASQQPRMNEQRSQFQVQYNKQNSQCFVCSHLKLGYNEHFMVMYSINTLIPNKHDAKQMTNQKFTLIIILYMGLLYVFTQKRQNREIRTRVRARVKVSNLMHLNNLG
eukprot:TRINITY_DN2072_c0_g1_i3.p1 TRINITY_DN2072_c0_g1~~TRINITY_DN2072_c0_g1_i3.p1  ORF type:complete len:179 (+),score=5.10 TRINITY_DN2072_c0_g1_i3:78-539(+)